jgi:hypothetical protein
METWKTVHESFPECSSHREITQQSLLEDFRPQMTTTPIEHQQQTQTPNIGEDILMMQMNVSNVGIQNESLKRLSNFATNEKNRVAIAATGGIDAILLAMQRHASNADVQENGCGALMNLSVNGNNQALIAAAGGMDAILLAMQSHVSNAYVQKMVVECFGTWLRMVTTGC